MKELCEEYGRSFEEMSAWYDGYELTAVENGRLKTYPMYNPKSVVDAMISGMFDNYGIRQRLMKHYRCILI